MWSSELVGMMLDMMVQLKNAGKRTGSGNFKPTDKKAMGEALTAAAGGRTIDEDSLTNKYNSLKAMYNLWHALPESGWTIIACGPNKGISCDSKSWNAFVARHPKSKSTLQQFKASGFPHLETLESMLCEYEEIQVGRAFLVARTTASLATASRGTPSSPARLRRPHAKSKTY